MDLSGRANLLIVVLASVSLFLLIAGVQALRLGSRTIYFRHRRQRVIAGWWMTGAGLLLVIVALLIFRARAVPLEPPVSSTSAPATGSASATPAKTSTPTPVPSRAATATETSTPTPHLPLPLEIMALSTITPQPSAFIGEIRFSESLDNNFPIGSRFEFPNPIRRMFASFAYSHMTYGAQFTALWYRNGELMYNESGPWKFGGHGRASSKWEPALQEWHPGEYEVQFFVGSQWKATGGFTVTGNPPTVTFTPTSTPTSTSRPLPSETPGAVSTP